MLFQQSQSPSLVSLDPAPDMTRRYVRSSQCYAPVSYTSQKESRLCQHSVFLACLEIDRQNALYYRHGHSALSTDIYKTELQVPPTGRGLGESISHYSLRKPGQKQDSLP